MSTPLLPSKNDGNSSDIEDLLLSQNTVPILNGKECHKNGGKDYYGKEILSKHVLKNYAKFDFSAFIPLIGGIRDNILDYKQKQSLILYHIYNGFNENLDLDC